MPRHSAVSRPETEQWTPVADTRLVNGRAKVKHQRREDPGTEGAEGVVRATGGGVWEGDRAPSRKKLNLGLKYTICGAFGAFFSSSVWLVLMQVTSWIIYLFFISTSGGERGPWPSPAPPWICHWWTHKRWAVRQSASWPGVSNLAEYTAVWAAGSVVGRPRQRTWLMSNDASSVCRPLYWVTYCSAQPSSVQGDRYTPQYMLLCTLAQSAELPLTTSPLQRRQQSRWEAYSTCNLKVKTAPLLQRVSTGSVLNRRSHSAEKYWIGPIQFWLDRAFSSQYISHSILKAIFQVNLD